MKRVLLVFAALSVMMLYATLTWAEDAPADNPKPPADGGPGDKPDRPDGMRKQGGPEGQGMADPFLLKPTKEIQAELERHKNIMTSLHGEMKILGDKIKEAVKAEVKKEIEAARAANPGGEPAKPDLKAIVERVKGMFIEDIKVLAAKWIEEDLLFSETMLELKKKSYDAAVQGIIDTFRAFNPEGPGMGKGRDGNGKDGEKGDRPGKREKPNQNGNGNGNDNNDNPPPPPPQGDKPPAEQPE
jgi:hypothetical protein